jgi:hypothetical protein
MPVWASTLLGVAVGGVLAFVGAIWLEVRRGQAERAKERRDALATYLGWLSISVSFVGQWPEVPPPSPLARFRKATLERSPHIRLEDWRRAQEGMRRAFGPNPYEPLYNLVQAFARLTLLPLDPDVRSALSATFEYIERLAEDRSVNTLSEWPLLRRRLLDAISLSGDFVAVEATEPAEAVASFDRAPPDRSGLPHDS